MRTIAIVLCDNDFGHTFKPLLESIYTAIQYHGEMTKEHIVKSIHSGIPYFYNTFQLRSDRLHEDTKHLFNEYLTGIKILFDEEAEKDIQTNDHDGGSWYLELQTGKVYSY